MAPGSWLSPLFLAVITLGLQWPQEAATFPAMPLSNLFANAVLRAQHLHLLAAETYKEFERTYIPEDQRHANKNSQAAFCYSETIPAPTGKDDAQQKSDMELLRFSLVLIQSWLSPVQYLSKVFTNNLVFGTSDRVYEKLKDLEEGIQALMRELEDRSPRGPQILKPTYDKFDIHLRTEDALLKNYGLLSCFKKDLHKVETYLKHSLFSAFSRFGPLYSVRAHRNAAVAGPGYCAVIKFYSAGDASRAQHACNGQSCFRSPP
ncbi:somatotropin isoform X1 [Neopsephotus bourkii]|uniref:somatotropin isoform X1 n=1 Tax=Neopsephotus bourkii TaxID=309878 RepID=UPI002AA56011|nr:somatotropin isoform X1 [Neopsephotus bourkii]